ncbi:hypothetical protein BDY19DRAFT_893365 [Irpex rosettiformis]|uniref:Uncharacterized protein n=1 Tax=Irpex rosettiformis TaxID=378272 RepID=A0ACB8TZT9_9APHY|nr:hypothetical protein BDY19DRAFT_893365 [Irpex rosettiformis]
MVELIDEMAKRGWDIVTLLHYLSWNLTIPADMLCEQSVIRYTRTALMVSPQLSDILSCWLKPPRAHSQGIRTRGAKNTLENWAVDNVTSRIQREMKRFAPIFHSPPGDMSEEMLLGTHLKDDIKKMKETMPTFWETMCPLARTQRQAKCGKYKDHEPRVFIVASILQYNCSQNYYRYQKVLSIYLKSCGLGGKANDTTHLFGLTMSQSWIHKGITDLSESNRRRMLADIEEYVFYAGHDNLNIPFKVYEMRLSKQSHFDNGTAGTVYVVKDKGVVRPSRVKYLEQRAIGCENPIRSRDIFEREVAAAPRLREQHLFFIKQFLLMHPSFTAFEAQNSDHPLFQRPQPVLQLPTGPEHATCQYMLDTVHMEEGSQKGNRKVIEEFLRQLGLDRERGRNDPDSEQLILWLGDQLTTIRIRFLKRDRSQDMNFQQRFDQVKEVLGLFHTQLNQEFSLHKQYFGTNTGFGFKHAFLNMNRKGLDRTTVQGNFHYGFREGVKHTMEARFRDIWLVVSGAKDFSDLAKRTPEELDVLARKILDEFASTSALEALKELPPAKADERLEHSVQFCRDLLDYLDFDDAIKTGDVGRIELLLPRLLFRFHGSGSHNYSHEILELMQCLWREWPPELSQFVMRFCWLANTTGHENGFLAFDMLQEHNVRDLKVIFAVHGPYASWDYIKRISASIPTQWKLKDHIEREFNHFRCGKSHTTPSHEADVNALHLIYAKEKTHIYKPG